MTDLTITVVSPSRRVAAEIAKEVIEKISQYTETYADISISAEEENTEKPEETATQTKVNKGGN